VVEKESDILKESQRLIEDYHDASHGSMRRVVVAPCSPFSVSRDLMREAAVLARQYGVAAHPPGRERQRHRLQPREVRHDPAEYAEDLGWVGHDVWHAHCVQLDQHGIELFARTGTGVAHCPCSNMRLASGIAPIRKMRDHGVPVGLGWMARPPTTAPA
jgi:cytosine/adenosine deaminase-related metal-dependent hydrolase